MPTQVVILLPIVLLKGLFRGLRAVAEPVIMIVFIPAFLFIVLSIAGASFTKAWITAAVMMILLTLYYLYLSGKWAFGRIRRMTSARRFRRERRHLRGEEQ